MQHIVKVFAYFTTTKMDENFFLKMIIWLSLSSTVIAIFEVHENDAELLNGDEITLDKNKYYYYNHSTIKGKSQNPTSCFNEISEENLYHPNYLKEVESCCKNISKNESCCYKNNFDFKENPGTTEKWFPVVRNLKYGIGEFVVQNLSENNGCILTNISYTDEFHKCNCTILKQEENKDVIYAAPCQNKFEDTSNQECKICKSNSEKEPKLVIREESKTIYVVATNMEQMASPTSMKQKVWCFTDSVPDHLYQLVPTRSNGSPHYDLTFDVKESGHYWCEFYHLNNLLGRSNVLLIITNIFYITKVKMNFVSDPTSSLFVYEKLQDMGKHFDDTQHLGVSLKWMKTLYLDDKIVEYLIHICTPQYENTDFSEQINENINDFIIPGVQSISKLLNRTHCLQSSTNMNGKNLTWPTVLSGTQKVLPQELCLNKFGDQVTRNCENDFFEGAIWSEIDDTCFIGSKLFLKSNYTENLEQLLKSESNFENIKSELLIITNNSKEFSITDIHLIALILKKIEDNTNIGEVIQIVSNVMNSRDFILKESQSKYNSSDLILTSMDYIFFKHKKEYENKTFYTQNIKSFVYNAKNNIYGMALIKDESYKIIEINNEMDKSKIASIPNLKMAFYVPKKLLQEILNGNDTIIVVNIFMESKLFLDLNNNVTSITSNFGILLPSIKFVEPIELYYRISGDVNPNCSFWNYSEIIGGFWVLKDKSLVLQHGVHLCYFDHATNFGLLVKNLKDVNYDGIFVVSLIGCSLSLLGALGIFITALIFKEWRDNKSNAIILNYSTITFIQIISMFLSYYLPVTYRDSALCVSSGVILHYTTISQFCWMFVFSFLQYRRYIKVINIAEEWVLIKASAFSYLTPIIPILILVTWFGNCYKKVPHGLCYPNDDALIYTILLPVSILSTANIFVLVRIYLEIFCAGKCVIKNDMFAYKVRLIILLFFMVVITWAFGILAHLLKSEVLLYLFCISASNQCFIIFIFFVVVNKGVKKLYFNLYQELKSNLL